MSENERRWRRGLRGRGRSFLVGGYGGGGRMAGARRAGGEGRWRGRRGGLRGGGLLGSGCGSSVGWGC